MTKRPISAVARVVEEQVARSLSELGGLEDRHLKLLTFIVKYEFRIANFRFDIDYRSEPKTITIHCLSDDGQEVYVRPKQVDLLDKMTINLGLPKWAFRFARKE